MLHLVCIILLPVILLVIYWNTLLPGIGFFGDSNKFLFVGRILGIPHATGFPLYLLLNHLFVSYLPLKTLAFRANLLSALFAIVTASVMHRFLYNRLELGRWISFVCACFWGVTFTFWSQSLIAEVYTLNILFLSFVVYFFVAWYQSPERDDRTFLIACACYALSFANHPMMITVLPALLFLVYIKEKSLFYDWKIIGIVSFFIFSSLALYFYFIYVTHTGSSYLETRTPDCASLWAFMSGGNFKGQFFAFSIPKLLLWRIPFFIIMFIREFHIALPLVFFGIKALHRKDARLNLFFLLIVCANIFWAINYDIDEIYVYPLISYFVLTIYVAIGLSYVEKKYISSRYGWTFILLPAIFFTVNYSFVSERNNTHDRHIVQGIFKKADRDAVIISPSYTVSTDLWYYTLGEQYGAHRNIHIMHCIGDIPTENIKAYLIEKDPLDNNRFGFIQPGCQVYLTDDFWDSRQYDTISLRMSLIRIIKKTARMVLDCRYTSIIQKRVPKSIRKKLYKTEPNKIIERINTLEHAGMSVEQLDEHLWHITPHRK